MRRAARICTTCHAAWWRVECRAAFEIGGPSSDCPANYSRLETEAACKSLAAIAGSSMYGGSDEYLYYPAGCFWHTVSRKLYWNKHGSGASNSFAQALCAGAPQRRHARQMNASLNCCSYMPHHHHHTVVSSTRYLGGYSGTRQSGSTRVLTIQFVKGYSGTGRGTRALPTQAVPGCSVLGWFSGHSVQQQAALGHSVILQGCQERVVSNHRLQVRRLRCPPSARVVRPLHSRGCTARFAAALTSV
jgi:hypothetical protein